MPIDPSHPPQEVPMSLAVVRYYGRWRYQSDLPVGTPVAVTHCIHVPGIMIPSSRNGEQLYRLDPHSRNLIDRPLTARQLLRLAHLKVCTEIYIHTTII